MNQILPEFQNYLTERKLAPENQIPFYAGWASKFIRFSNAQDDKPSDLKIQLFLDDLKKDPKYQDWQIVQAENAVRFYVDHFLKKHKRVLLPDSPEENRAIFPDAATVHQKIREALRIKHYAYSTERTYTDWFQRFHDYLTQVRKKDWASEGVGPEDVRDYLSHLAIKQRVAASTQNQAFNALLFVFREVLHADLGDLRQTVRAKRGPKLPVVLTVEEVAVLLRQLKGRDLLVVKTLYGAGMRLMEAARLRVQDIDFGAHCIIIRGGKGDKDRSTLLPEAIKDDLMEHLAKVRVIHEHDLEKGFGEVSLPESLDKKYPNAGKEWRWQYVFPANNLSVDPRTNKIRRHHISSNVIQKAVADAVKRAGIPKHATVHTLRHSFATHLLMDGVNIREVQELLGHKNVETTMIYTHVIRDLSHAPKSPLDALLAKSRSSA